MSKRIKSLSSSKLPKLHKIPPLIKTSAEWRLNSSSNLTSINKYRPKMLLKIHISYLDSDEIKNLGTRNLRRALVASKTVSSFKLEQFEYGCQNAWQLERTLSFSNHLKMIDFCFTDFSKKPFNAETIKSLTRLGRCRNLRKLKILLDIPVNIQDVVLKGLNKQIPKLKKLKALALDATHSYTGWSRNHDLNATLLKLKPPKSLLSLSLDFTRGDFPLKQLSMFTKNLQRCHLLENLALNYIRIGNNMKLLEGLTWALCFHGMQNLKKLTFNRCIFPGNELQGTEVLLASLGSIKKLTALNLYITSGSREMLPFILLPVPLSGSLKSLNLSIYNFVCPTYANFRVFLTNLQSLTQLEKLHLNFSGCPDIDDSVIQDISQTLGQMKNLKVLNLRLIAKNITDEGFLPFAQAIKLLVHLTILRITLKESNLSHNSIEILANSITNLKLTSFTLLLGQPKDSESKLQSKNQFIPLFSAISGFKELSSLTLSLPTFEISTKEMKSLSQALKQLKKLSDLSLKLPQFQSANNFEGLQKLLSSLVSLTSYSDDKEKKNLTWLKLVFAGEELCHKELSFLISDIEKCDSLEFLYLKFQHSGNLEKKSLKILKPKFGSLAWLKNVVIRFKELPWQIPKSEFEPIFWEILNGWHSSLNNLKEIRVIDEDQENIM